MNRWKIRTRHSDTWNGVIESSPRLRLDFPHRQLAHEINEHRFNFTFKELKVTLGPLKRGTIRTPPSSFHSLAENMIPLNSYHLIQFLPATFSITLLLALIYPPPRAHSKT